MANIFSLTLVIATLITGLLWYLSKFVFALKKREHQIFLQKAASYQINSSANIWKKIGLKLNGILNGIEVVASVFPILFIVLIVRSFVYEPFHIPSGSMMPTLLIGDLVLIEKFAYGIKDPIFQKTLIKIGYPKRGDIVVFKYPDNPSLYYIKRVVGLPGDTVIYDPINKEITIQPKCNPSIDCKKNTIPISYSKVEPSDFVQTFILHNDNEATSGFFKVPKSKKRYNSIRLFERRETLGDITHRILTMPIAQNYLGLYYQQMTTWIVPMGEYFMMGDNRDNSMDSRYWGFVPEKNLIGKATAIWMSFEKQEGEWPTGLRLNRIGKIR